MNYIKPHSADAIPVEISISVNGANHIVRTLTRDELKVAKNYLLRAHRSDFKKSIVDEARPFILGTCPTQ